MDGGKDEWSRKIEEELGKPMAVYTFQTFVDRLPHLGLCLDVWGRIAYANARLLEVSGWTLEEILGRDWFDLFIPPASREATRKIFVDSLAAGRVREYAEYEVEILTKEGRTRHVAWLDAVARDASGEVAGVNCLGVDISARTKAQRALSESRERFRLAARVASDLIYEWDPSDDSLTWFGDLEGTLGYEPLEIPRSITGWLELMHPQDRKGMVPVIERQRMFRDPGYRDVYRIKRKDGSWAHWEDKGVPLLDDQGRPVRWIGACSDITARIRNEMRLNKAREAAEAANRTKSEFIANISHEVRTPLNGLLGLLQLLQQTRLDDRQQQYVAMGLHAGKSLLSILNDILDLSVVESGKAVIRDEPFDPRSLIRQTADTFSHQSLDRGVLLLWDVAEDIPATLRGDAGRIRQILFNLVGNAVKFTSKGMIQVAARLGTPVADGRVALVLSVSDTGIGIPKKKLKEVFAPFTQVDGSLTRQYGGVGLGLAIVRRYAEMMGGVIDIASEEGQGATFTVTLPLEKAAAQETGCSLADCGREEPERHGLKVLVAEDEPVSQLVMHRMLESMGHSGVRAATGREALLLLQKESFDVVLMDIQMPEMDGLEAARHIREGKLRGVDPDIPIIALTAHAMVGDRERFLSIGMSDYLAKPVDMDELERVLDQTAPECGSVSKR